MRCPNVVPRRLLAGVFSVGKHLIHQTGWPAHLDSSLREGVPAFSYRASHLGTGFDIVPLRTHWVPIGQFEKCPRWDPIVDDGWRSTPIPLKTHQVERFDHNGSWAAKVRNVSRVGSQKTKGKAPLYCLARFLPSYRRHPSVLLCVARFCFFLLESPYKSPYSPEPYTPAIAIRGEGRRCLGSVKPMPSAKRSTLFLTACSGSAPGALFPSNRGKRISRQKLDKLMRKYALAAAIPAEKRHFHVLKHSIATHLRQRGADILHIRSWLGHRSSTPSSRLHQRSSGHCLSIGFAGVAVICRSAQ
jgi:hypothetical protein